MRKAGKFRLARRVKRAAAFAMAALLTAGSLSFDSLAAEGGAAGGSANSVNYQIIDMNEQNGKLAVTNADGVMTLSQSATTGNMKTQNNVSYLVFPETADKATLSLKLKVKSFNEGFDSGSGVFVGAFMSGNEAGKQYFMSLGFRNPAGETTKTNALSAYYFKTAGNVGNGSPKIELQTDTEYTVALSWNSSSQMEVTLSGGASGKKTFNDVYADLYDHDDYVAKRRFGIAIVGATAEVKDMVYKDSQGNVLFDQNNVEDEPDPNETNGFVAKSAGGGISYTFNFADNAAKIYDLAEGATASEGTAMKSAGLVTVNAANQAKFHDSQHGTSGVMDVNIAIAGTSKITVGTCTYAGGSDTFTVTSETGTVTPASHPAKGTCGTSVDFYYKGDAGSIHFTGGGYVDKIVITPIQESEIPGATPEPVVTPEPEPDPNEPNGFVAKTAKADITYTFNFADDAAKIYNVAGGGKAEKNAPMKSAGLVTVNAANQAVFWDTTHGTGKPMDVNIAIAGTSKITVGTCTFSGENDTFTVTSESGTVTPESHPAKGTCGKAPVDFYYKGEAGSIRFTGGGYVDKIVITPIQESEIPGATPEPVVTPEPEPDPNEPNGFVAKTPKADITYTFNFADSESKVYVKKTGAAAAAQGDGMKSAGLVTVNSANQAVFWDTTHGTGKSMDVNIAVAGTSKISVYGCTFSGKQTYIITGDKGTVTPQAKAVEMNCDESVDYYYKGEAGSLSFVSTGGYLHKIVITPIQESDIPDFGDENEPDPNDPNGFVAAAPVREVKYTFDFGDATAKIYDIKGAVAAEGTAMKSAGLVTVNQTNSGTFHDTTHGTSNALDMNIAVAGDCKINITACFFSGETDTYTLSSETGTISDPATQNAKAETDGGLVSYTYTGGAGSVKLTSTGGYTHKIEIVPIIKRENRKIEVWDFTEVQEKDETIYHNNIPAGFWKESGLIGSDSGKDTQAIELEYTKNSSKTVTVGDLLMRYENGDRLYGGMTGTTHAYANIKYADGYTPNGLWYGNGKGGTGRRYVIVNYVEAGDKVVAYMGSHTAEVDQLHFQYQGGDAVQDDTAEIGNKQAKKYEFIAKYDGAYKIYVGDSTNVKPFWHRIVVVPGAKVSGSIDLASNQITGYGLKFVNDTTEDEITADVAADGSFTVSLTPGYSYTAVLTGVVGYGITSASKTVNVPDTAAIGGMSGVTVTVESRDVHKFSGSLAGFDAGVDLTAVKVILTAAADSQRENVSFRPNADGTFETYVESGVSYTISLEGVNDYELSGNTKVLLTADEVREITVAKKAVYQVAGSFLGLQGDAAVTSLRFVNMDDDYAYDAAVEGAGYSVSLRNGTYVVNATVSASGYSTISHVVVKGAAVERDLLFTSNAAVTAIPFAADIYVGYPEKANNYNTVKEAVRACEAMRLSNAADRITVHIAPGVYREQVILNVPYVTFVNDEPEKEVKLTWYYGIGYVYYSINSGYYSEASAFDKFEKKTADKWGVAFYIKSGATEFRAENITFEASFNKYVTEEEIADGVEPGGGDRKNYDRTAPNADVTSKAGTERSSAIAVEGNRTEFYNCKFLGSQDTLYTGNNIKGYFKNCYIEGNTDYIFGGGDFVYDGCELNFCGYSETGSGGYITAAADGSDKGYVFRNCYITGNEKMKVNPGDLGRPWRASATVSFINTKLEYASIILARGWNSMSGNLPQNANYAEYNTIAANGDEVDLSKRAVRVSAENPIPDITRVFNGWTPVYYRADTDQVALDGALAISNPNEESLAVGDVLTADFSLGDNEHSNVSVIRWYRVSADGTETLIKSSVAQVDRSYTVTSADTGAHIKVSVLPETVSGYTAAEQTATSAMAVGESPAKPADYTKVDEAIAAADKLNKADYVDFSAVEAAVAAVERGLTDKDQAKVDAMAKAITDAIAALEKKPGATATPGPDVTPGPTATPGPDVTPGPTTTPEPDLGLSKTENVKADEGNLDEAIKNNTELKAAVEKVTGKSNATAADVMETMKQDIVNKVQAGGQEMVKDNVVVQEISVAVSSDGGKTWRPVTAEDKEILEKGITLILPYPSGTNRDDFDFLFVTHLITMGPKAGTIQNEDFELTDEGLKVTVHSASPFAIGYAEKPDDDDDDEDDGPEETADDKPDDKSSKPAKTGDSLRTAGLSWTLVLLAAFLAEAVFVYLKRHRNEK